MNKVHAIATVAVLASAFAFTGCVERGTGVDANEANVQLSDIMQLPPSAHDVNYAVDPWSMNVEFAVSQRAFIQMCKEKGWEVRASYGPLLYKTPGSGDVVISTGLHFEQIPNDDCLIIGVFDPNRDRASVIYTRR